MVLLHLSFVIAGRGWGMESAGKLVRLRNKAAVKEQEVLVSPSPEPDVGAQPTPPNPDQVCEGAKSTFNLSRLFL